MSRGRASGVGSRVLRGVSLDDLEVDEALGLVAKALDGSGDPLLPLPLEDVDPTGYAQLVEHLAEGDPLAPGEDDPSDPTAVVLATSGSTGPPKGALLPASALRASAEATQARLGGPAAWLLALPAHHVAGVQVLVRSVVAGTIPVRLDLSGGFDPAEFARATVRLAARSGPGTRRCTAVVPTQLVRLLEAGGKGLAALVSYDAVLVGGAATTPALLARARAAGVRVVTTYGMSETSGGCVYDGQPLDGVRVRVDERGEVYLGGPVVARGYRGRVRQTARSFEVLDGVRWFRTGDLGKLTGGQLEVQGRMDDVIVSGGLKVAPAVVEAALAGLAGIEELLVVGVPDDEWGEAVTAVVVASDPEDPPTLSLVRKAARGRLPSYAAPRRLVVVTALPLRGPGKPDRVVATRIATEAAGVTSPESAPAG